MRILPRLIRRRKSNSQTFQTGLFRETGVGSIQNPVRGIHSSKSKDIQVLGELSRGTKRFEHIQKNTGFDRNELNSILKDLENRRLMRVEQKQGLIGIKVELYLTEKGFREYNSQDFLSK